MNLLKTRDVRLSIRLLLVIDDLNVIFAESMLEVLSARKRYKEIELLHH